MTKPTIEDDIAALSAAIDAGPTPGPWNTAEYTDHDGPPCCDDIAVQASSPRDALWLETLLTMDWSESPPHVAAFTREEAMATAAYIAAASPDRIARLIAALQGAREELSQPARVGLTECNTNDSPWLICKTCAAAGRCAKTAPQKAMTADQIERHIGADEDDREAVAVIVREVEAWHGIERAHNIPAAQEGR